MHIIKLAQQCPTTHGTSLELLPATIASCRKFSTSMALGLV